MTEVAAPRRADRLAAPAFAASIFLGAFLLFLVQPLVGKFILPWFGGSPGVWTTCMLFFQAVLLAGYAYAHLGAARLSPRAQAAVYVTLLAAAVLVTAVLAWRAPFQPPAGAGGPRSSPALQILLLLGATVALPCLVLSATSPLLNAWYARADHGGDGDAGVYRLYAVSNAGSLLALLAYPFVVEPALTRRAQALSWAAGLVLFAVLCAYCAWHANRTPARLPPAGAGDSSAASPRTNTLVRTLWILLPATASVLLLATTNTLTHDVAAVPLLWVLPLALYLLTFVFAFARRRLYRRGPAGAFLALATAGVCLVLIGADVALGLSVLWRVALLSTGLFAACLVCHGELAALKPPPAELTAYYLAIAAGGAAGGVLVGVAAPLVLDRYVELHLGLWTCCALAAATPYLTPSHNGPRASPLLAMPSVAGLVILAAVLWAARDPYSHGGGTVVGRWRDFHGVVTLYRAHDDDPERDSLLLRHAGVTHGRQFLSAEKKSLPTTYFGGRSGAAAALRPTPGPTPGRTGPRRVGVVGLGAGTLAAYGRAGDVFRFYELSPTVERVARDHFTFLAGSPARCEVVIGDARLSMEREPPQNYDVLVLDAFSGHAIPAHLLTAEAFDLYRRHLAPAGVIAVHVSNRFLDLQPVVARQAERGGWHARRISNEGGDEVDGILPADWVLLTVDAAQLAAIERAGGVPPREDAKVPLWTDEYASLYHVLRRDE